MDIYLELNYDAESIARAARMRQGRGGFMGFLIKAAGFLSQGKLARWLINRLINDALLKNGIHAAAFLNTLSTEGKDMLKFSVSLEELNYDEILALVKNSVGQDPEIAEWITALEPSIAAVRRDELTDERINRILALFLNHLSEPAKAKISALIREKTGIGIDLREISCSVL